MRLGKLNTWDLNKYLGTDENEALAGWAVLRYPKFQVLDFNKRIVDIQVDSDVFFTVNRMQPI